MEQLKDKLFEVFAGSLKTLDFEKWLYEQQDLMEIIESNTFVYQVVCLDYKNLKVIAIDRLCDSIGDEEAYVISKIERGCREILNSDVALEVLSIINKIGRKYVYDTDFRLLYEFYSFEDVLYVNNHYKPCSDSELLTNAKYLANSILFELDNLPLGKKKSLLFTGLPETFVYPKMKKTRWHNIFERK